MNHKTKDKLLKLLALYKRGVGGEKENAKAMLDRILAEHGMTMADIDDEAINKVEVTFSYNEKEAKILFIQVVARVCGADHTISRYRNSRTLSVEVTPAQKAEILVMNDVLWAAYRDERKNLMNAFIIKHRVWDENAGRDEEIEITPEQREAQERAVRMARGLQDVELTKRLEAS